jgi:hypothetical protein
MSETVYKCFDFIGQCLTVDNIMKIKTKFTENVFLLTETDHAIKLHKEFKRYLKQVTKLQNEYGLEVCYIKDIQSFSDDFEEFLKNFDYNWFNEINKIAFPDWYRKELQVYIQTLQLFFSNLQSLYADLKLDIKDVQRIKDKKEREKAFIELRNQMTWLNCEKSEIWSEVPH